MDTGSAYVVEDRVRVVIAEDSVLLREGLTRMLTDRGHDVVAGVGDAEALLKTVADLAAEHTVPDVVVTDVRMPPSHTDEGVRAAVRLRREHPRPRRCRPPSIASIWRESSPRTRPEHAAATPPPRASARWACATRLCPSATTAR